MTNYASYFVRIQKAASREQLRKYSTHIRAPFSIGIDKRLGVLYEDCFGHHVTEYTKAQPSLEPVVNHNHRIIPLDRISAFFLEQCYIPPTLLDSSHPNEAVPFMHFCKRASGNAITTQDFSSVELGTNTVNYLTGDVGEGKSLLISKLLREVSAWSRSADGYELVTVYYDFEARRKENRKLEEINDDFFFDLFRQTHAQIDSDEAISRKASLDNLHFGSKDPENALPNLRNLFRHLARNGLRVFFIFDNLDRYHFAYTRYSFFPEGAKNQALSVQRNIGKLIRYFTTDPQLSLSGLSVLIVCRQYVFDYLTQFDEVQPKLETATVFSVNSKEVSVRKVLDSRMKLYRDSMAKLREVLKNIAKDPYQDFLEHILGIMAVEEIATRDKAPQRKERVLEALHAMGHNGYRSIVQFLASLQLLHKDADALMRLFDEHPNLLLILYMLDVKQRFSEHSGHFPNIFLNDCLVTRENDYPGAHQPHAHTYWLKYFLLKTIDRKSNCNAEDLFEIFCPPNDRGYEKHLVQLMLGALCTSDELGCVDIDYEFEVTRPISDLRLQLTRRGKYLISPDTLFAPSIEVCLGFNYLQLACEDRLLALPKAYFQEIWTETDYSYLYFKTDQYNSEVPRVLRLKAQAVLHFLYVLAISLKVEMAERPAVFRNLFELGCVPDINVAIDVLLQSLQALFRKMNREKDFQLLHSMRERLGLDNALEEALKAMFRENVQVMANA